MDFLILLQIFSFVLILQNLKLLSNNEYDLLIIRCDFIQRNAESFKDKKKALELLLGISMNVVFFTLLSLLILRGFNYAVNKAFIELSYILTLCVLFFNLYAKLKLQKLKIKIKNRIDLNKSAYNKSARKKISTICKQINSDLYINHFLSLRNCESVTFCCMLKIVIKTTLVGFLINETIQKTTKMDRLNELHYAWKSLRPIWALFFIWILK